MTELQVATTSGTSMVLDEAMVHGFKTSLRGPLLRPGDAGYDDARHVWNGMIDRRPALIVRCTGVADVITAVQFARTHNLLVAVRGGGHNVAGHAVYDGGLMIDLSRMKGLRVDPIRRTAHAQAGLTLGEFDRETQAFGLATPMGYISATGIAGLTLGGGYGWLARSYGLAADNLLSVDVVTADGQCLTASATAHADLFWGVRGGGGNFGVVTSFEYQLHPVGPVLGGMMIYPFAQAKAVLQFHRDFISTAPDAYTCFPALGTAPTGVPVALLRVCYNGPSRKGNGSCVPCAPSVPLSRISLNRWPIRRSRACTMPGLPLGSAPIGNLTPSRTSLMKPSTSWLPTAPPDRRRSAAWRLANSGVR